MKTIFEREYYGFEDAYDISRDIYEMFSTPEGKKIPAEWQGTIKITVTYEESDEAIL